MITILFILCFALIALAFFLIILLYLKFTQLKDIEIKQERLLKEFESVITSYVMEIKEDNEVFLNRIQQIQKSTENNEDETETLHKYKEKDNLENRESTMDSFYFKEPELTSDELQDMLPSYSDHGDNIQLDKVEIKSEQVQSEDQEENVDNLVKDIEILMKHGLSYEEIAKKLKKGKTEVEL